MTDHAVPCLGMIAASSANQGSNIIPSTWSEQCSYPTLSRDPGKAIVKHPGHWSAVPTPRSRSYGRKDYRSKSDMTLRCHTCNPPSWRSEFTASRSVHSTCVLFWPSNASR